METVKTLKDKLKAISVFSATTKSFQTTKKKTGKHEERQPSVTQSPRQIKIEKI
jgi:hypothetical protein